MRTSPRAPHAQRYTLSHLAHDVKKQTGITEPTRDWFPISMFMSAFADFADLVHGPEAQWGTVSCGCHPNCGVGTALMINKETKEWAPVPAFLNVRQLVKDIQKITDAARGKKFSNFMHGPGAPEELQALQGAQELGLIDLIKKFDKSFGALRKEHAREVRRLDPDRTFEDAMKRRSDPLELALHRRHVVPGSVQLRLPPHRDVHHSLRHAAGRNHLLRLQHGHRLAEDHREHAQERDASPSGTRSTASTRSTPTARRSASKLTAHTLKLVDDHVNAEANDTLDKLGIAKNARQEKFAARDAKVKAEAEKARMMALYKEHVLGEKPVSQEGFIPLGSIGGIQPAAPAVEEREAVYGD